MKHTQGKWKRRRNGMIFSGSLAIAKVRGSFENENKDEYEANAKLIASAPELLEACKLALRDYKYVDGISDTTIIIKQAIASAEENR